MKKVNSCVVENCIPTPSSCVTWNGGDIEYLGICNGDSLNLLVWEIVGKLKAIAGEDLSEFDIDSLLGICNEKAPAEVTLLSILTVLKDNQLCLKEYIDNLIEQIAELSKERDVNVNLKCFQELDNLGNSLKISRDELDQLVINNLCSHKDRITTLEGKVINLQTQIDELEITTTVEELNISTCVDSAVKPTSSQVKSVATAHCSLEAVTGTPTDISSALGKVPSTDNSRYGLLSGWVMTPDNQAKVINNLLLKVAALEGDLRHIQETCCASSCDDVKIGYAALMNEDYTGIILRFTSGAGTLIPAGFTDKGSTGTITDINGTIVTFNVVIANNYETEINITGLDTSSELEIEVLAKLGTATMVCEKCVDRVIKPSGCSVCEITATGDADATASITYEYQIVT